MNLQQFILKVSIKPRVFIQVSMGIDYSDPLGGEHEPQAPQLQHLHCPTLQMKGRWESNINVWFLIPIDVFPEIKLLFPKQNYNVLSPISFTYLSVRDYIFPRSVCLFCCREICGPILGIYIRKSLIDTWMGKLGLRPRNSQKKEYINGIFLAV